MGKLDNYSTAINQAIGQYFSKAEICKLIGCRPSTLNSYLKKEGIEYGGNKGSKGRKTSKEYKPAMEYILNGLYITSHKLKNKLIKDGIKEHKCECCGGTEWMGQPIPIELDHIDGNHYNNALENLRLLCPNCHSQTPTNSGKKNKKH